MEVKLEPNSVIKASLGLDPGGKVHKFFTAECARQMDPFVPFDKGILAGTVISNGQPTKNVKVDTITYDQKYAKYVYYGKNIVIHTKKHPKATTYWDQQMWSAKGKDITDSVQDYVNRGGK